MHWGESYRSHIHAMGSAQAWPPEALSWSSVGKATAMAMASAQSWPPQSSVAAATSMALEHVGPMVADSVVVGVPASFQQCLLCVLADVSVGRNLRYGNQSGPGQPSQRL